jgi:hypothetical protein
MPGMDADRNHHNYATMALDIAGHDPLSKRDEPSAAAQLVAPGSPGGRSHSQAGVSWTDRHLLDAVTER